MAAYTKLKKFRVILIGSIVFSCLTLCLSTLQFTNQIKYQPQVLGASISSIEQTVTKSVPIPIITIIVEASPTPTETLPTPTLKPKTPITTKRKTDSPTLTPKSSATQKDPNSEQYNAKQIDETTWKVSNVELDDSMASPQDILNALNSYRGTHSLPNLSWDSKLGDYAQERATLFNEKESLDSHAGFKNFMDTGGFDKAGFNSLGENSAYLSGPMNGERIVLKIFGADPAHDGNQLDDWTHVGIGVKGVAINVNFGKNKK